MKTWFCFEADLNCDSTFLQKSHKSGIKLFKLCNPEGYTYNISIYSGKVDQIRVSLPTDTVLDLADANLDAGHTACTDNFYTESLFG